MAAGRQLSDGNSSGTSLGQTTTDTVSLFGVTPTSQPTSATLTATASLFAVTGASYVANTSATVSGVFGFTSAMAVQVIDTFQALRTALVALGIHKGGA